MSAAYTSKWNSECRRVTRGATTDSFPKRCKRFITTVFSVLVPYSPSEDTPTQRTATNKKSKRKKRCLQGTDELLQTIWDNCLISSLCNCACIHDCLVKAARRGKQDWGCNCTSADPSVCFFETETRYFQLLLIQKNSTLMMKTRFFTRSQKQGLGGGNSGGMLTTSERSAMLTDSDRSAGIEMDIDIDFSVTESGRTVAHLVNGTSEADDGLDFSVTSSGRTIEHIIQEQASGKKKSASSNTNAATGQTIVPAVTATISNPLTIPTTAKSPARPIPTRAATSRHGSEDSSGSAFLSGILNPSPPASHLSHTPPTALGSSYENKHFGKRQRSGVSTGCEVTVQGCIC